MNFNNMVPITFAKKYFGLEKEEFEFVSRNNDTFYFTFLPERKITFMVDAKLYLNLSIFTISGSNKYFVNTSFEDFRNDYTNVNNYLDFQEKLKFL